MRQVLCADLVCHPASPIAGVVKIAVSVLANAQGAAQVTFDLTAEAAMLTTLVMPAPRLPAASDQLWRHTCGELFVAVADAPGYREFNFSPSGEWAGYVFSAYRKRDTTAGGLSVTAVTVDHHAGGWRLRALLPPGALPGVLPMQLAATMVLEAAEGGLSYWALRHPAADPDFHHRDGFLRIGQNNVEQNNADRP
jgi:hypothetical protein